MAEEEIEIRTAPKVLPWMLTGAAIGMLIAFGSLGLGLGVALAIAFDLISARRAKRATANRVTE